MRLAQYTEVLAQTQTGDREAIIVYFRGFGPGLACNGDLMREKIIEKRLKSSAFLKLINNS